MKGRNSQLMRIFKILTLLETHRFGLSVAEITAKLDERGLAVSKLHLIAKEDEVMC
jgi:hypothetical protein